MVLGVKLQRWQAVGIDLKQLMLYVDIAALAL
jgi:hypothetical protein